MSVGFASRDSVCSSCERAICFDNGLWISCGCLSLRVWKLAAGVGMGFPKPYKMDAPKEFSFSRIVMHPRSPELTRFSGPGITALPTIQLESDGVGCGVTWNGGHFGHSSPDTRYSQIGCQGWTRTNTVRFNKPSCYFDTTWQLAIGAAGRICTCIGSFRRRMPRRFRPRQHLEMVSAAGIAPAIPRSQAECVGCYATR